MFLWRTHTLVPLFPSCTLYRSFTLNLACQHHNTIPSGTFLCKYFCMHAFFKIFYYVCISSAVCVCEIEVYSCAFISLMSLPVISSELCVFQSSCVELPHTPSESSGKQDQPVEAAAAPPVLGKPRGAGH